MGGQPKSLSKFLSLQLLVVAAVFLFTIPSARSSELTEWAGAAVRQSHRYFTFEAGKRAYIWFDVKNLGSATWRQSGEDSVALVVVKSDGRLSPLFDQSWKAADQPTPLDTPEVKPGDIGRFKFIIQVPETTGDYVEHLAIVPAHRQWIPGTEISLPIRVLPVKPFRAETVQKTEPVFSLQPGEDREISIEARNTGPIAWKREGRHFITLDTAQPKNHDSALASDDWLKPFRPTRLDQLTVEPGTIGRFTFTIKAPENVGTYHETFRVVADGFKPMLKISLSLIVVQPSVVAETAPGEPDLRVGLFEAPNQEVEIVPRIGAADVISNGKTLLTLDQDIAVRLRWTGSLYRVTSGSNDLLLNDPPRVVPKTPTTILEILNVEQRPSWNLSLNDNTYRGILELRYATKPQTVWLINELPLELYLRGIAEAGDDNSTAYLKALIIAARTYAMFHYLTGTKHGAEGFHVNATADQVYRGYGFEQRSPNITRLIEETKGLMVTLNGEVVVTPYFSWTDGRTRSWEEVWAGEGYPHLKAKQDPCCGDRELFGHGVGMSALGAIWFAEEKGWDAERILKYYYTDIELKKFYGA